MTVQYPDRYRRANMNAYTPPTDAIFDFGKILIFSQNIKWRAFVGLYLYIVLCHCIGTGQNRIPTRQVFSVAVSTYDVVVVHGGRSVRGGGVEIDRKISRFLADFE